MIEVLVHLIEYFAPSLRFFASFRISSHLNLNININLKLNLNLNVNQSESTSVPSPSLFDPEAPMISGVDELFAPPEAEAGGDGEQDQDCDQEEEEADEAVRQIALHAVSAIAEQYTTE